MLSGFLWVPLNSLGFSWVPLDCLGFPWVAVVWGYGCWALGFESSGFRVVSGSDELFVVGLQVKRTRSEWFVEGETLSLLPATDSVCLKIRDSSWPLGTADDEHASVACPHLLPKKSLMIFGFGTSPCSLPEPSQKSAETLGVQAAVKPQLGLNFA